VVGDGRNRDKKQKLSAGVDSLERNGLATITEIYSQLTKITSKRQFNKRYFCLLFRNAFTL